MKAFKKPVEVRFEYILEPCVIMTLEGPVKAGLGQVKITGVRGESYPVTQELFERDYIAGPGASGFCYKKKVIVDAEQLTEPTSVKVSWSDCLLHGKVGDYLVNYPDGSQGIVEESIFKETYEVIR